MWECVIRHEARVGDTVRREDRTLSKIVAVTRTGPVGQDVTIAYADGRVETADADGGLWVKTD
jgi:hypothetical protein